MGCSGSATNAHNMVQNIPDPEGDPIDPLTSKTEILESIQFDPHIHYFKNQMEGVFNQASKTKKKKVFKSKEDLIFATTDKKEY